MRDWRWAGAASRLSGNGGAGFGIADSTIMPGGPLVLQGNSQY